MDHNLFITQTIDIAADTAKVWNALTDPEKIKIYLFGTETICDWKVGSPIVFQGEFQGQAYKDKGTILEFKPEEVLKYDYWSGFSGLEDQPEHYSVVTFKLESNDDKTTLFISQKGFASEQAQQHSNAMWEQVGQKIKEIAESL